MTPKERVFMDALQAKYRNLRWRQTHENLAASFSASLRNYQIIVSNTFTGFRIGIKVDNVNATDHGQELMVMTEDPRIKEIWTFARAQALDIDAKVAEVLQILENLGDKNGKTQE
jgi:hypothetical protein